MGQANTTRRQVLAGATAATAVAPVIAWAQPAMMGETEAATRASTLAAQLFVGKPAPALSLAVANSSAVIWAEAFGKANVELDVPATTQHTFRIGSVSKVLTATAAARLATRGALDLDLPISRWLPDLPEHHRETTVRQLLTHTGGVRHFVPKDLDVSAPGGAVYMRIFPTRQDVLALFIDDPLVAPPGTRFSYSSYGYTLASMAMEAAAGMEFRQLIRKEIGGPFGLASLAADDPWAVMPGRATGYMNQADVELLYGTMAEGARPRLTDDLANTPLSNPAYCWAGGGYLMTPADTARFGAAMFESAETKISTAERTLLFTPTVEVPRDSFPVGLGWRVDADARGRVRWHHAGTTIGGRGVLVVYPELGLSVAIAGNVMAMPLDMLKAAGDLADIFA